MRKLSTLLLGFLLIVGCAGSPLCCKFGPSVQALATCKIRVGEGQGSGTLIAISDGQALVLTCRHVAEKADLVATIEWPSSDQKTEGRVLAIVPGSTFNNDLALIVCDAPKGLTPVRVAKFDPEKGPWRAVGFKGDQCFEAIGDAATEKDGLIKVNSPWTQGMSGCGLFDKDGCIVGVIVASDMETYGLASDGLSLENLISQYAN